EYQLVWADEFNRNGKPDPAFWNFEEGFKRNHELQWYQDGNAYCKDGLLVIEARQEKRENPGYKPGSTHWAQSREYIEVTSSSINTAGKKEFCYGRFEVKARIPIAGGAWPAIWTLGTDMEWPSNGEIDLMEYYRIKDVPHILANVAWGTEQRYNAKWNSKTIPFTYFTDKDPDWASKFHIWRMDWDETAIKLYLDDELLNEIPLSETINGSLGKHTNPFKQPHYLLLNLAIGGDNGGTPDFNAFPMKYEIDYVRVYQKKNTAHLSLVGNGYSKTSVNTTVFRNNSLVTHKNKQYIAYYDADCRLTLGKRKLGTDAWQIVQTPYTGNCADAHNVISLMVDGDGYLHLSFDHHGHPLKYCKSTAPESLELGELMPMTGNDEDNVTYPEFYCLPGGDLIFVYRSGSSGRGNLVMNRYSLKTRRWERVQNALIDGENQRNAYWQLYVDRKGTIHLSWVWRETWLVETNHDLCYARSKDGGKTWEKSDGTRYALPINAANAEYAWRIPQNSELINQTSMTADRAGNPYIATYWRDADSDVPQYRLVWFDGSTWKQQQVSNRKTPFSLSGGGTKMIPIARPRLVMKEKGKAIKAYYIFRDVERGSKVSMAYSDDILSGEWTYKDLTHFPVDAWEPGHDTELWKKKEWLHLFIQRTAQGDGERMVDVDVQPVYVLEL
ncbi:BNR-4 repeat-containing protein, partial [Bacteroides sp. OttesenSCG-928-N06]|nr:BNR-4 repeat-containing protein [Bacteroides sp. OttesenSCG-928-N06]